MGNAKITSVDLAYVDRLREIVASAHALRCSCGVGGYAETDPRCLAIRVLAQEVPR